MIRGLPADTARAVLRGRWKLVAVIVALTAVLGLSDLGREGADVAKSGAFAVLFYGAGATGLFLPAGLVAGERASGVSLLWRGRAGSLVRFYLIRYALVQLLNLAVLLVYGLLAAGLVTLVGAGTLLEGVGYGGMIVLVGLLSAAISFGFSGWGVTRDAFAGLLFIMGSITLAALAAFETMTGEGNLVDEVVRTLGFPVDALTEVNDTLGAGSLDPGAWGVVALHLVAWTLIGALGIAFLDRRPVTGGGEGG